MDRLLKILVLVIMALAWGVSTLTACWFMQEAFCVSPIITAVVAVVATVALFNFKEE